ncbi:MAG: hypothetical protein Q4D14_05245 [Bacteroidales bacterium]|nr:hypothetical protein [Bacteroidales bacterium]
MKVKRFLNGMMAFTALIAASMMSSCGHEPTPVNPPVNPDDTTTVVVDYGDLADILFENETQIGDGGAEFEFKGKATLPKGTYTLKGWIYICDGAELTIPAGTVIKGDDRAALIVEPGGKLHATGTASQPIVFTSAKAKGNRKPGDWGGVIICGRAQNNQTTMQIEGGPRTTHGGNDNADNSGELQYVRIEFAGYPFAKDKEINGLTMGSVGSGTKIDHVQVSYCNDDSFEWFGGAVNCDHLVAFHGWDDEFDTDNGFSGKVQFCLGIRDPKIADTSKSNGFESDNDAEGDAKTPFTTAQFSNCTFVGPMIQDANFSNTADYINGGAYNPNNGSALGIFQASMHLRRNTRLSCANTLTIGWPVGIIIDNQRGDARSNYLNGNATLKNIVIADCGIECSDFNGIFQDNLVSEYSTPTIDNTQVSWTSTWFKSDASRRFATSSELNLTSAFGFNFAFVPASNSSLLNVTLPAGFNGSNYVGAFAGTSDNWLSGWTEFDPNNQDY